MKHIIFVRGIKDESDRFKIQSYLENTRVVSYEISVGTSSVMVDGANDSVHQAKQAILQAGYEVE